MIQARNRDHLIQLIRLRLLRGDAVDLNDIDVSGIDNMSYPECFVTAHAARHQRTRFLSVV